MCMSPWFYGLNEGKYKVATHQVRYRSRPSEAAGVATLNHRLEAGHAETATSSALDVPELPSESADSAPPALAPEGPNHGKIEDVRTDQPPIIRMRFKISRVQTNQTLARARRT